MKQGDALIGHTGFVGSNLLAAKSYDATFNSKNISEIRGRHFDRIVCAGISAKKWIANRDPEADRTGIAGLADMLRTVQAERFILISTIDVYVDSTGVDEQIIPGREGLHPYGLHRLEFEDFVRDHFPYTLILRLPALFGPRLSKNILYDLLNNNLLERINPASVFQWYPVIRLADDIETAAAADLELVHLATEPIPTRDILNRFFSDKDVGPSSAVTPYDFHTRYAAVFGGQYPYMIDRESILQAIGGFVASEKMEE